MKVCQKCQTVKSHAAFHKNRAAADGHYSVCRSCKKALRDPVMETLSNARNRAKARGMPFDLTADFLHQLIAAQGGLCAISKLPLTWDADVSMNKQRLCRIDRASIDRIDSHRGYTQDNVQLVTDFVNRLKKHHSLTEIYRLALAICKALETTAA